MTFEEDWHSQNDYLRSQLLALDGLPRARRRTFQLFVLRCKECGDVVLEVMDARLPDGQSVYVVQIRHLVESSTRIPQLAKGLSVAEYQKHFRAHRSSIKHAIRLDKNWRFFCVSAQMTDRATATSAHTACRCRADREFSLAWIYEQIESGPREQTR